MPGLQELPLPGVPLWKGCVTMAISVEAAAALVLSGAAALPPETVSLEAGWGRVLAAPLLAAMDQPPFPRSPLDGYALRAADSAGASRERPVSLPVAGRVCAGEYWPEPLLPGTCLRIMTGAPIPAGADCVIRQEDTDGGAGSAALYRALAPYENYCFQGEDFHQGEELLPVGLRLDAAALAVAASAGAGSLSTVQRPRASILSTGDELTKSGQPLAPGKIYNSNQAYLSGRLTALGAVCVRQGQAGDSLEVLCAALEAAVGDSDVIFTTGGVSVGQKDLMPAALSALGAEMVFHGVAMKPGMPTLFARLKGRPVLALSGNPFAAAVAFERLGRPLLAALGGDAGGAGTRRQAVLENSFDKASPGRRFVRGRLTGERVWIPDGQGNGQMRSMVGCNCLIDIPAGSGPLRAGDTVTILPL